MLLMSRMMPWCDPPPTTRSPLELEDPKLGPLECSVVATQNDSTTYSCKAKNQRPSIYNLSLKKVLASGHLQRSPPNLTPYPSVGQWAQSADTHAGVSHPTVSVNVRRHFERNLMKINKFDANLNNRMNFIQTWMIFI